MLPTRRLSNREIIIPVALIMTIMLLIEAPSIFLQSLLLIHIGRRIGFMNPFCQDFFLEPAKLFFELSAGLFLHTLYLGIQGPLDPFSMVDLYIDTYPVALLFHGPEAAGQKTH